jgi:uracil-DNA glycosylase family 4
MDKMRSLNVFIEKLRLEHPNRKFPNFDPNDGGSNAQIIFVLEAPGPKVLDTYLISRNNPDQTAHNMRYLLQTANIKREDTLLWNVVPWIICENGRNVTPVKQEINEGANYLIQLIKILPNVKAIVLVGKKAQMAEKHLCDIGLQQLKIFKTLHPSPKWINRHPNNKLKLLSNFHEIASYLYS